MAFYGVNVLEKDEHVGTKFSCKIFKTDVIFIVRPS